jgi:hypothetical protein
VILLVRNAQALPAPVQSAILGLMRAMVERLYPTASALMIVVPISGRIILVTTKILNVQRAIALAPNAMAQPILAPNVYIPTSLHYYIYQELNAWISVQRLPQVSTKTTMMAIHSAHHVLLRA